MEDIATNEAAAQTGAKTTIESSLNVNKYQTSFSTKDVACFVLVLSSMATLLVIHMAPSLFLDSAPP